jgi:hypothetical protein
MRNGFEVICKVDDLSEEALLWLADYSTDLAWVMRRTRSQKIDISNKMDPRPRFVTTFLDSVVFASQADATYFKLKYL